MKKAINMLFKSFSSLLVNTTATTAIGRYFLDQVLNSVMSRNWKVRHLTFAGPVLKEKRHSEMFDGPDAMGGGHVWNQIWIRK
jgi:putative Ca2+/H+ antiporter (TMEM165/GDT1 family)